MIWNGLRVALAIFSGKISLKFGLPERRQTLRKSIFTGRVVEERSVLPAEPPERVPQNEKPPKVSFLRRFFL